MIAESRQAWTKIDEEMKKLEQRSFNKSINLSSEPTDDAVDKEPTVNQEVKENVEIPVQREAIEKNDAKDYKSETKEVKENVTIPVHKEQIEHRDSPMGESNWFSPIKLVRFPSLFGDDGIHDRYSLFKEENVIKVKDDDKAFEITMDTSQYRPDELNVNVLGNSLTVEAKHTEQSEDGRNLVSKQFVRRYTLPNDCKGDLVSSNLSADGVLVISAPKYPAITEIVSGRNVPILMG